MKNIKIIIILIFTQTMFSQVDYAFVLEDSNTNVIANQTTLEFTSIEYPDASFNFFARNLTNEPINLKAEVISISGSDGTLMEFCFGECYYSVDIGLTYPLSSYVTIQPGETQISSGDHFFNQNPGDGENPIEYSFRFFMVDENGDEVASIAELETEYYINYYYSPSLGLDNLDGLKLVYFLINNRLFVSSESNLSLKIYDLTGRVISKNSITIGNNLIDIKNISKMPVILSFESDEGQLTSKKIFIP